MIFLWTTVHETKRQKIFKSHEINVINLLGRHTIFKNILSLILSDFGAICRVVWIFGNIRRFNPHAGSFLGNMMMIKWDLSG